MFIDNINTTLGSIEPERAGTSRNKGQKRANLPLMRRLTCGARELHSGPRACKLPYLAALLQVSLGSPPKELSMTVIGVEFKTVHEKSSLKGASRCCACLMAGWLLVGECVVWRSLAGD